MHQSAMMDRGEEWERFAREDALRYILTSLPPGQRKLFWKSGETGVREELLPIVQRHGIQMGTALEIGCGVGRLALPLARHFRFVVGIDVSREMVRQAETFAHEYGCSNTRFLWGPTIEIVTDELNDFRGQLDFVYSVLVFQHIEDFQVIEGYHRVIGNLLSKNGIAYLQFDTRPKTIPYRIKTCLPDFVLPRTWRRGIRRIRREPREIERAFMRSRLEVVDNGQASSEYHCYVVRQASGQMVGNDE